MAAATAGLSRVAAGAGAAPATAAAANGAQQRGLRTAAAAASPVVSAMFAGQMQLAAVHQQRLPPLQAVSAPAASFSALHTTPQRPFVNLAAAAAAAAGPVPGHLAGVAQLAGGARIRPGTPFLRPPPQHPQPHTHPLQQRRRRFASVAAAAVAADAAAFVADYDGRDEVGVGSLVEFERNREYLVGRALKLLMHGWQVEVASGTVYSVKHADIKFVLPGGPGSSAEDLRSLLAAAQRQAAEPELLELAWELAKDSGAAAIFTVPRMADFLFTRADPSSCTAALRLLRDDRMYFKQVGRNPPMFSPRTEADVQSLQTSLQLQAQAEVQWSHFLSDIQASQRQARAEKPGEAAWRAGRHAARLAAVEALALGDLTHVQEEYTLASKTLAGLGKTPSTQDACELLQSIGWWEPHLQLNLLTAGVTEAFPAELEAAAQQLLSSPPPDPDAAVRQDFTTSHTVYTIDDASTTEIDDGLSLERLPDGGVTLWVHIADPSRWLEAGTPLAQEAAARSKSVYLPTGVVPMFPKCLAEGPFSLRQGHPTESVSVGCQLSPDGALLAHSVQVVPSRVAPARKLTYVDTDELFEECSPNEEADLFDMRELARLRREHRLASGACEIQMPESSVTVRQQHLDEPVVRIEEEGQHQSASRQMVAEMMILAGEAVGELGRRLGVPLPYRGQAEPVLPDEAELAGVPPGPCQAVLLRQCMTRSVTLTAAPVRHAGLGLDAYVQFTSPIRRYGDLLAHWQLKAALRQELPGLSADLLACEMDAVAATTQRLAKLERETESYWVAEYFRQIVKADPGRTWPVTFLCWLKQEVGLGRVMVEGLGLETVVRINSPVQPGDRLSVRCVHTDVKMGMWRLDAVGGAQGVSSAYL